MHNIRRLLFVCILLLVSLPGRAQERITSFHVLLQLDTSNQMTVTEHINIIAEGLQFKRGLFRKIPYERTDKYGHVFENPIDLISVTQDGEEANYKTNDKQGKLEIKIGSADIYLTTGAHSYTIVYSIKNQIGFFDDYDEIYWNVTGTEWSFPIDTATCEVRLPQGKKRHRATAILLHGLQRQQSAKLHRYK